jgi:hypothetical protein
MDRIDIDELVINLNEKNVIIEFNKDNNNYVINIRKKPGGIIKEVGVGRTIEGALSSLICSLLESKKMHNLKVITNYDGLSEL